jgi:hypothetical protein
MANPGSQPRTQQRRRVRRRSRLRVVVALLLVVALAGSALIGGWMALTATPAKRLLADPTVVPAELTTVLLDASKRCEAVPVEVLAAQIAAESGWDPQAVSPVGASGIAQFMPEVWDQYGIDGDEDGRTDIWNPVDAIHSAAALNCVNRKLVRGAAGDRLTNTLAAYNAGFGNVLKYDGVPPFPETEAYVARILEYAKEIRLQVPTEA